MLRRFLLGLLITSVFFPFGLVIAQGRVGQDSINQNKADLIIRIVNLINQLIEKLKEQSAGSPVGNIALKPEPPVIFGVTPDRGPAGTQITVKGSGFLSQNNTLYTGYGSVTLPSSDGQTLTFTFSPPYLPAGLSASKKSDFPELVFGIYVINEKGQTAEPGRFIFVP